MLQYKVDDRSTLDILIQLNNCTLFKNYRLVGGTALALIQGHRKSIDLDFYISKFKESSVFFALKSVLYFEDAETEEMPFMFNNITWQTVKDNIKKAHINYMIQNELPSE